MWDIILNSSATDPIELQELKHELVNNSCKCRLCAIPTSSLEFDYRCYNKEVQATNSRAFLGRCSQVCHSSTNGKDPFCPGCHLAMSLLRNKNPKVLKDEESETKAEILSSDKSTEKIVRFEEKTTSTRDILTPVSSKIYLCDMMKKYCKPTSDSTVPENFTPTVSSKFSFCNMMKQYFKPSSESTTVHKTENYTPYCKRTNEKVKFEKIPIGLPKTNFENNPIKIQNIQISRNCLCMENFINSIRPPLTHDIIRF